MGVLLLLLDKLLDVGEVTRPSNCFCTLANLSSSDGALFVVGGGAGASLDGVPEIEATALGII
jgi:hypothetical protein